MAASAPAPLPANRIIFLDKIRYSLVIGVVVLHAACAYAHIIPWWSVRDPVQRPFFDLLLIVLDIFLMPVLFFLAGFFALPSLSTQGSRRFISVKLRRLGIPLLLIGLFFVPLISFIGYRNRTADAHGFFRFWWMQMQTVLDWRWVNYATTEIGHRHVNDFSLWHLWFISLLLIFFILTALVYRLSPRCFQCKVSSASSGSRSILLALAVAALTGFLGFSLVNRIYPDAAWSKIAGLIVIQPTRAPLYIAIFVLGLYANSRGWFSKRSFPGSIWLWLAGSVVCSAALPAVIISIGQEPAPIPWPHALAHGMLRSLACLVFLGFIVTAAQRYGDRPSLIWRHLHAISYDIYLIHLPFVIVLQLALLHAPVSIYAKFAITSLAVVGLCWLLARGVIRPYPVLASGLLLAGFALGCFLSR
jgi:peptidoglycan/LPS O-acetylase OafA/YrhL